jgi:hypothetical protein
MKKSKLIWFTAVRWLSLSAALLIAVTVVSGPASGQTDEIQVYDASIAEPGVVNLTWHNNYTPDGRTLPSFPGAVIPDKSWNGVTEWAYGVTPWMEAGLYLPLYSVWKGHGASFNGAKLRFLFVRPHADEHEFFYGVNFEFSFNESEWDPNEYTSEIRPILGLHLHPWDFIVNPILDNSWQGGVKSLDFAPETRIAYHVNDDWAVAVEEYDDIGPLRNFYKSDEQFHEMWGVFDHYAKWADVEAGIGFGLTPGSDKITLKLMFSRDLFKLPHFHAPSQTPPLH